MELEGLIVSEGTLIDKDILVKELNFLKANFMKEFAELMRELGEDLPEETSVEFFAEQNSVNGDVHQWIMELVYNVLDEIAPEGYYYGSSPGDGACFGFWEYD